VTEEFNQFQLKQIADTRPKAVEFFKAMPLEKVRELKSLVMPFDADVVVCWALLQVAGYQVWTPDGIVWRGSHHPSASEQQKHLALGINVA
jgi:hypothetical protein